MKNFLTQVMDHEADLFPSDLLGGGEKQLFGQHMLPQQPCAFFYAFMET